MAGIEHLLATLNTLPFAQLDDSWVRTTWEKDFVELDSVSDDLIIDLEENNFYIEELRKLQSSLEYWIHNNNNNTATANNNNDDDDDECEDRVGFWTALVESDVSYKHFIAFLAYLIESSTKSKVTAPKKHAGLLSSCTYFQLVSISGSGAFKIFNPLLFNLCLDVLRRWTSSVLSNKKHKLPQKNSQKNSSRAKRRKLNKNSPVDNCSEDEAGDGGGDDESDESECENYSPQDVIVIQKALVRLLKSFITLVQNFSLRGSDSSLHKSIQVMCELIRPFTGLDNHGVCTFDLISARHPVDMAYVGLKEMCSGNHGNPSTVISIVYKQLMSSILMFGPNNKSVFSQSIPVAYTQCRHNSVSFVCRIINLHGHSAMKCARTLIQHLCVKTPDKTEYRSKLAESIVTIMDMFDVINYGEMVKWMGTLVNTSKSSNRMVALEIFSLLLLKDERQPTEDLSSVLHKFLKHKHYIGYIVDRCSDNTSSVRARAILLFSHCIGSKNRSIVNACQSLFTPQNQVNNSTDPSNLQNIPPVIKTDIEASSSSIEMNGNTPNHNTPENKTPSNDSVVITGRTPFINLEFTFANNNLSDDQGIISMLKRRSADEKVFVRKSALLAFESLVRLLQNDCQIGVKILEERCNDPSLAVRKQAMQSLSTLLFNLPTCFSVQKAWLHGVLPLILDCESTLQEKCMKCLEEALLQNLCPFNRSVSKQYQLTWNLLQIMAADEEESLRRYFQRVVNHWSRLKLIKVSHINILKTYLGTEYNKAAWMMLSELSTAKLKFDCGFVVDFWKEHCSMEDAAENPSTQKYILKVLLNMAWSVPFQDKQDLVSDLSERLLQFTSPVDLIPTTIGTIKKLAEDKEFDKKKLQTLCEKLIKASDKYLSKLILSQSDNAFVDEEKVICHLFCLGEVCQLHPKFPIKHILFVVQSIIASPGISDFALKCSQGSTNSQEMTNSQGSTNSQELTNSQGSTTNSQTLGTLNGFDKGKPGKDHKALLHFAGSKLSSRVRGHAFITLGKFCLQNEDLAKKCVAALVRELETSSEEAIRNNVVFILCDLCIRYTTLVDQYIGKVAACLNDVSPLIRKQTMTLLTMLIQEDYLKWKGPLFYHFIMTYLDETVELQKFSEFCFVHCLLVRNPNLMFCHFLECIFYFNHYQKHPMYNRFSQDQAVVKNSIDLRGRSKFDQRWRLYTFMLQHMTDEQKINLSVKLNQEILAGVVDGVIDLDADGSTVLQDSLVVLGSREIKISLIVNQKQADDNNLDEQEMAAAVIAKANKNIISKVMKTNLIENVVPIVTSLKRILETKRSPVLKELMLYLQELIKDYKTEIQQILSADKQLADEIEFDLRKFEQQQQQQQQEDAAAAAAEKERERSNREQQQQLQLATTAGAAAGERGGGGAERLQNGDENLPTEDKVEDIVTDDGGGDAAGGGGGSGAGAGGGRNNAGSAARMSLSKRALLNSVRKSIEKIQLINVDKRKSLGSGRANTAGPTSRTEAAATPKDRAYPHRAISTPFAGSRSKGVSLLSDVSLPSPIRRQSMDPPSSSSDTSACTSSSLRRSADLGGLPKVTPTAATATDNVIRLTSPMKASEQPSKVWDITPSPRAHRTRPVRFQTSTHGNNNNNRKRKTLIADDDDDDDDDKDDVTNNNDGGGDNDDDDKDIKMEEEEEKEEKVEAAVLGSRPTRRS
ncbi:condensin-2 complex subunit D3-like [Argonauta hians]